MSLKNNATKLAAALALVLLVLSQPGTASAVTRYHVRSGMTATVRNTRNGFVLGTLFSGEAVDVRCKVGIYGYGFAHGDADRTGWVLLEQIRKPEGSALPPTCSKPYPFIPLRSFMRRLKGDPYGRTVEKNSVTCPDGRQSRCDGSPTHLRNGVTSTRLYFNLRNGAHVKRHSVVIGSSTEIRWRYVTSNNGHVLVRAGTGEGGAWGFIVRGDMPPSSELPVDTAGCMLPHKDRVGCKPD